MFSFRFPLLTLAATMSLPPTLLTFPAGKTSREHHTAGCAHMLDGSRITTRKGWRASGCRNCGRFSSHYMYGRQPSPVRVKGKICELIRWPSVGKATLKEVAVNLGWAEPIHLMIVVPNQRQETGAVFPRAEFLGKLRAGRRSLVQMPAGWSSRKIRRRENNRAGERAAASKPRRGRSSKRSIAAMRSRRFSTAMWSG